MTLFVGWLLGWYSSGLWLSFKHSVYIIIIFLSFSFVLKDQVKISGTLLAFMLFWPLLVSFAAQPWLILHSEKEPKICNSKTFFNCKCPPTYFQSSHCFVVTNWKLECLWLPPPLTFVFVLTDRFQAAENTLLFRGYIDNVFQMNVNVILAFLCYLERLISNMNGSFIYGLIF